MKGHVNGFKKRAFIIPQCIFHALLCSFHKFRSAELSNIEGEKKNLYFKCFVNFFPKSITRMYALNACMLRKLHGKI